MNGGEIGRRPTVALNERMKSPQRLLLARVARRPIDRGQGTGVANRPIERTNNKGAIEFGSSSADEWRKCRRRNRIRLNPRGANRSSGGGGCGFDRWLVALRRPAICLMSWSERVGAGQYLARHYISSSFNDGRCRLVGCARKSIRATVGATRRQWQQMEFGRDELLFCPSPGEAAKRSRGGDTRPMTASGRAGGHLAGRGASSSGGRGCCRRMFIKFCCLRRPVGRLLCQSLAAC